MSILIHKYLANTGKILTNSLFVLQLHRYKRKHADMGVVVLLNLPRGVNRFNSAVLSSPAPSSGLRPGKHCPPFSFAHQLYELFSVS